MKNMIENRPSCDEDMEKIVDACFYQNVEMLS